MAYTKVNWVAGVTPLSEANMDHLETQYDEAISYVDANVTREIYAMAHNGVGNEVDMAVRGVAITAVGGDAFMRLLLPADFSTITAAEVIFMSGATGADMHCDIITYWGSKDGGENYNVHTEVENARDIGATVLNQYLSHSITDLLDVAAPAAGDVIVIRIAYDATAVATNVNVSGVRLKYT